jgi:hypothetical protein
MRRIAQARHPAREAENVRPDMSFHVPANQTNSWNVFWQHVANDPLLKDYAAVDYERFKATAQKRFDAGEPVWMVAAEMKMLVDVLGTADNAYRKEKTLLQLARRVVRM